VIQYEAHALANVLLGKRDMPRVVETRKLWEEATETAPSEVDSETDQPVPEPPVIERREEQPPC